MSGLESLGRWPFQWQEGTRSWRIEIGSGQVAAPLVSSPDDLLDDPSAAIEAARASGNQVLFVGEARNMASSAQVLPNDDSIRDHVSRLLTRDVGVASADLRWALLASEAEFGVAVGEPEFVEILAGGSLSSANAAFSRSLDDWVTPPPYLVDLAKLDWESYQRVEEPSVLHIPFR